MSVFYALCLCYTHLYNIVCFVLVYLEIYVDVNWTEMSVLRGLFLILYIMCNVMLCSISYMYLLLLRVCLYIF